MFWQNQPLLDTLFLLAVAGWGILIVLLALSPGLVGFAVNAYRYHRSASISLYLARFIPSALFTQLVELSKYLLFSVVLISGGLAYGLVPSNLSGSLLALGIGGLVGGLYLLSLLRRASTALWSYVFWDRTSGELLQGDYRMLSVLKAIALGPIALLALSHHTAHLTIYVLSALVILIILLRIWQAIRRLGKTYADSIHIFLYLCTHELLPWLYIALGIYVAKEVNL